MFLLILGLALWYATHLLKPMFPAQRAAFVERHGENAIKGLITALSLLALILIIIGYRAADFIPVWTPPGWTVHLNNVLMIVAVALMAGAAPKSPIKRFTRHPMLNGVKTWAVAHLLVNGDLASIILFGAMLTWAVIAMIAINRRDGKPPVEFEWTGKRIVRLGIATIVTFVLITAVHSWLGVWPFPH